MSTAPRVKVCGAPLQAPRSAALHKGHMVRWTGGRSLRLQQRLHMLATLVFGGTLPCLQAPAAASLLDLMHQRGSLCTRACTAEGLFVCVHMHRGSL